MRSWTSSPRSESGAVSLSYRFPKFGCPPEARGHALDLLRCPARRRRSARPTVQRATVRVLTAAEHARLVRVRARAGRKGLRAVGPPRRPGPPPSRGVRGDPGTPEAAIHQPSALESVDPGTAAGVRLRSQPDVLRRAAAPDHGPRRLSARRPRVSVPSASGHVVLGAVLPAQLVAAGLRGPARKRDGVPPTVLEHAGPQLLPRL